VSTPAELEAAYQRYAAAREVRQQHLCNGGPAAPWSSTPLPQISAIRMRWYPCSLEIRQEHGPVRALIHGAGVLRDRRIVDKRARPVRPRCSIPRSTACATCWRHRPRGSGLSHSFFVGQRPLRQSGAGGLRHGQRSAQQGGAARSRHPAGLSRDVDQLGSLGRGDGHLCPEKRVHTPPDRH
jgi:hypothetical protein